MTIPEILAGLLCAGVPIGLILLATRYLIRRGKRKSKEINERTRTQKPKYQYNITSLDEIFKTDFSHFDPEDYNKGKRKEDENFVTYYKEFESEEAGVFRYLKVNAFESGGRNYIFYIYKPNKYHRDHLRRLVDKLHSLYGKDDSGNGTFTPQDDQDIEDSFWTGRRWTKNGNHPSLMIGYDDESGLNMTIWKK